MTSLNGLTGGSQTFTNDTNVTIVSGGTAHVITWSGTLADSRIASASTWNAKQNAITTGTTAQYFRGDLSLATFPTAVSSFTNDSNYLTSVGTSNITNASVTYPKLQDVAANSFLANVTGSAATVQEIATNRIPLFSSAITGTADATTFLCGNGTWAVPSGGGGISDGDKGDITVSSSGTVWTIDNGVIGLAKLSASGTASGSTFLRGDNTWVSVSASAGGSDTHVQFNNGGSLSGDSDFIWNNTTKRLSIGAGASPTARLSISGTSTTVPHLTLVPLVNSGGSWATDGMIAYRNNSGTRDLFLVKDTTLTKILTRDTNSDFTHAGSSRAVVSDASGNFTTGGEVVDLGIFSQSTQVSITTNSADTSTTTGTIVGNKTLPANWWAVGKIVKGYLSCTLATGGNSGNITFKVSLGGTQLISSGAITYTISTAATALQLEYTIVCRAVGASGVARFETDLRVLSDGSILSNRLLLTSNTSVTSGIATTGTLAMDVTANLSATANTLLVEQNYAHYLN